ncbi:transcriptional regulator, AraC family [Aliiroseovarius halocynthiae]|uniref:AraC family transcriptional regulator n=1 Tax=Aliiroseovarius halocynthiae TaxID=985055 RepID=A0A545SL05_9RHOB|nr:AraC family transcriptional regulator [Aliiroseovarius halocynthiae]TQV65632.1 AraC family transcriptional regulator [Aliiroseovarius halocynthiae]SMR84109.1 transcriptional regulator, AraC family [Aliiroseovarius halocynthiae]
MRYEDRLLRVLRYIHDNPAGDLSLDTLADVAAMSRFHWHRVFHAMTGETCAQVVRRMRLHRAAGRLIREKSPIDVIAVECGYPQPRSFVQAFRASYGMTPNAFRKAGRLDAPALLQRDGDMTMYPVEIRDVSQRRLIGLHHKGAYMQIGLKFEKVSTMLFSRDIWHQCGAMMGAYFDDPQAVAESDLRSFAGAEWQGGDTPDGFDMVEMPAGRVAVLTFKGPYATLKSGYDWLYGQWLPTSGETPRDAPCYEVYLNNPREVAPEELLTEIHLPIA